MALSSSSSSSLKREREQHISVVQSERNDLPVIWKIFAVALSRFPFSLSD
jgi:hypothetical protein